MPGEGPMLMLTNVNVAPWAETPLAKVQILRGPKLVTVFAKFQCITMEAFMGIVLWF